MYKDNNKNNIPTAGRIFTSVNWLKNL